VKPITFTIPGKPSAWQRANRNGKRTYDTAQNTSAKDAIAWACKAAMGGQRPFEGPVKLTALFVHQWPKATTKKRKALANGFYKDTRPDCDNYLKLIMDAMNGIAYQDDGQVSVVYSEKIFDANGPATRVTVQPLWGHE